MYVQCRSGYRTSGPDQFRCVGEPEFVVAADPSGFIAGIVGFADLRTPDVDDVLAALGEAADGRLRGIRQTLAYDESPEISMRMAPARLMHDSAFQSGLGMLCSGRDWLLMPWFFTRRFPELTRLSRENPNLTLVLDHLGGRIGVGPYGSAKPRSKRVWRASLTNLARCPNVTVKLGGIGIPLFGKDWHGESRSNRKRNSCHLRGRHPVLSSRPLASTDACLSPIFPSTERHTRTSACGTHSNSSWPSKRHREEGAISRHRRKRVSRLNRGR